MNQVTKRCAVELSAIAVSLHPIPNLKAARGKTIYTNRVLPEKDSVREALVRQYAKYVGTAGTESGIEAAMSKASSVNDLCHLLGVGLSDDDRYHFEEFTRYYGYSS